MTRFDPYNKDRFASIRDTLEDDVEPRTKEFERNEVGAKSFPLNQSKSKVLKVSYNVSTDFSPCIAIGRPGWIPFQLSVEGFRQLCATCEYINEYFNQRKVTKRREVIPLGGSECLEFKYQWNKRMVLIRSTFDSRENILLAKASWQGLMNVKELVMHHLERMNCFRPDVSKIFRACGLQLKNVAPPGLVNLEMSEEDVESFGDVVQKQLHYNDLQYTPSTNPMFDANEMFLNIRYFCVTPLYKLVLELYDN